MADERIAVLYFSNSLAHGGAEEHILTLLRRLDRARFRPLLACTAEVAAKIGADVPTDVPVVRLHLRHPSHVGAAVQLGRVLRRERVSVLHSHLFYASLFASPIARLCGVPLVVETPHVRERWRHGAKASYLVDRLIGRCVGQYVAVSEANRRYLIEDKRLPSTKIVVIHNGCDLGRFDPRHAAPSGLRPSLRLGPHDPVILAVGRLEPQKGHVVLLEAMRAVRQAVPAARLVCVGEGALRGELEARASALRLGDAVRFVGQQPNIPDWLALATITVLPSLYEGLPLAAIESLAAGRPMVATSVDGTPEVVVHEETGLTVPPSDPGALAAALIRLLTDATLRGRLATCGRERVTERFSDLRQVARTEALYELHLQRRGALPRMDFAAAGGR